MMTLSPERTLRLTDEDLGVIHEHLMNGGPYRLVHPLMVKINNQLQAQIQPPAPATPEAPTNAATETAKDSAPPAA